MNLIHDVMKDAAETVVIPFYYGSADEVVKTIQLKAQAQQTVFPAFVLFNNYTENRERFFTVANDLTIILLTPASKIHGATSEQNEIQFDLLQDKLTEIITAFCKDSRIQGITPLAFTYELTRLYTAFGGNMLCELRVNFNSINFINQC